MALPTDPAQRHRQVAADFTAVVAAVRDWDAPTPVEGWAARDVVDHLATWVHGFLGAAVDLPAADPAADAPSRWQVHADGIQQLLDDPASATARLANPHLGELPLAEAIDRFYTTDVFLHTWDLARSNGLEVALDEDECAALLAGMVGIEALLRDSGQFGPAVPVPGDASVQDRLMGFIGRDPSWQPRK